MSTQNNTSNVQNILNFVFSSDYTGELTDQATEFFHLPANFSKERVDAIAKNWLDDSLATLDLGQYFYDEGLFNEDDEIESSEFLIYTSDIKTVFGWFMDEVLEVANDLGFTIKETNDLMAPVNYFIEQCVLEYKQSLKD